jgi:hypothetical protein
MNAHKVGYKLVIVEILILLLPGLVVSYIIYDGGYNLDASQFFLFGMALVCILAGLTLVRQIFDGIVVIAAAMKEAVSNDVKQINTKNDVWELHEISTSFHDLARKLAQASEEVSQKTLELSNLKELTDISVKKPMMDDLMDYLLEKSMSATDARIGSVFLVDPTSRRFRIVSERGHDGIKTRILHQHRSLHRQTGLVGRKASFGSGYREGFKGQ